MCIENTKCEVCGKKLFDKGIGHFAEINRGWFEISNENGEDEIIMNDLKFNIYICNDCFLNNPDLCKFFNKIGLQVR